MSGENQEESFETMDPDDYIIGLVHLPPGSESTDFLNLSDPAVVSFLKKYFKKISKHPELSRKKIIPSTLFQSDVFALASSGSEAKSHVPFIGKKPNGEYCVREFEVQKLEISRVHQNSEDADILEIPTNS
ncbi:hypothetical protein Ciccas_007006 [Cichlidogyrus casuarinus]|uniref:Uncharacterized protein n=1 Tax=Cichlidogyrus casuarinus TaxID=1844966 RepID=A0ABD2Q4E2_9PLAT